MSDTLAVRVTVARWEAQDVASFEFAAADGADLPAWSPGAHIDVHLPSGTVRQYSLCGDPDEPGRYRIAVLALPDGRGGSMEAHRELRPGRLIEISFPRSNFTLVNADRFVFVAGGIGITPLLPMIREVETRGIKWELVYGAKSTAHFAFVGDLDTDAVQFVAQDADGVIDVGSVVRGSAGAVVYCCGPRPLMDSLVSAMSVAGRSDDLYLERFGAASAPAEDTSQDAAFDIELARSQMVITVQPNQSVLDAVRAAGVDHPSSCEMGFCGTCETRVLSGEVDHRDDLLTVEERAAGATMLVCVSRSKGCQRLRLDI